MIIMWEGGEEFGRDGNEEWTNDSVNEERVGMMEKVDRKEGYINEKREYKILKTDDSWNTG